MKANQVNLKQTKLKGLGIQSNNAYLLESLKIRMYRFLKANMEKENLTYMQIREIIIFCLKTIKKIHKSVSKESSFYYQIMPIIFDNDIEYIIDCLVSEEIESLLFIKTRKIIPESIKEFHLYKETLSIEENKMLNELELNELKDLYKSFKK